MGQSNFRKRKLFWRNPEFISGFLVLNMNKLIDKFYLEAETYYALDKDGNRVRLWINYWDNKLGVRNLAVINDKMMELRKKVKAIGRNLLDKKHKVNFAYKYENL